MICVSEQCAADVFVRRIRSAGAKLEVTMDDGVLPVALVQPPESDEAGDRLVHPLPGGADHPGQLLLRHGNVNWSLPSASSSSRFAVRPVTSRNTESASASSIARNRSASILVTFHSNCG